MCGTEAFPSTLGSVRRRLGCVRACVRVWDMVEPRAWPRISPAADMGEGRGSSLEVLVRLGWWCGGDSVPCRVDAVPCRTAAEKKACFHFVSDDRDGLVAAGLMALVMAVDMVTRRRLDGGVVTAQARCSEAKRARRRARDGVPVRGHDDDGVGAGAWRGLARHAGVFAVYVGSGDITDGVEVGVRVAMALG